MTEQRTPDALSTQAENELICEKLLGWQRSARGAIVAWSGWHNGTPTFTTWAEAGLILEALQKHGLIGELQVLEKEYWFGICWRVSDNYIYDCRKDTGPLAVRSAALEYIKATDLTAWRSIFEKGAIV